MKTKKQLEKEIEEKTYKSDHKECGKCHNCRMCWENVSVRATLTQTNEIIKLIEDEKKIVKKVCLGLAHPSQDNQEEFTKWLQDTVNFHLNQAQTKIKGEENEK